VIAADGGTSPTRRALGITMESLDFDEPWIVIDVICNDDAARRLPDCVIQYCEPDRPTTYVLGPRNHRRWEMMLLPGEDPNDIANEERVWDLLRRWITPADASLWRYATYVFHALIAPTWRDRRIFLAGDAAHMMPPFMAQGMIHGLRDVANLAWKLDAVVHGANPDLLDTYEVERRPHVHATSTTAKNLGRVICELDPGRARDRDANMLTEFGDPPRVRYRQNLIPALHGGFLDPDSPAAGQILPQPRIDVEGTLVRLDDATRHGFVLVAQPSAAAAIAADRDATAALTGMKTAIVSVGGTDEDVLRDTTGVLASWLEERDAVAALVRPDHYVYGTASDAAAALRMCTRAHRSTLAGHGC
jgi:3-(3-hydroxy-phenyl)propionate hydroxylase